MKSSNNTIISLFILGLMMGFLIGTFVLYFIILFDFGHIIENNGYVKQLKDNSQFIETYVNTTNKGLCIVRFDYSCPYTFVICQSDLFKKEMKKTQ